jgi:hypothetical protein
MNNGKMNREINYVRNNEFHNYKLGDLVLVNLDNENFVGNVISEPQSYVDKVSADGVTKQLSHVVMINLYDKCFYPKTQLFVTSKLTPLTHTIR